MKRTRNHPSTVALQPQKMSPKVNHCLQHGQSNLDSLVAGAIDSKKMILVDTGAGSHLFTKDFDPCAQSSLPSSKHHLVRSLVSP